jgi:hypothetical protein
VPEGNNGRIGLIHIDVPEHDYQGYLNRKSVYQKVLPLKPGLYKLTVVVKDDLSGHTGNLELGIHVPHYDEDKLSNSSLILADQIQPLPTTMVGSGPFVIGGTKVRPSVNQTFTRDQSLGIYMQVYNLGVDPKTHKPSADVQYDILRDGKPIVSKSQAASEIKPTRRPCGVRRRSALSIRRCRRNSAREVNMRYGSSVPLVTRSSIRMPI